MDGGVGLEVMLHLIAIAAGLALAALAAAADVMLDEANRVRLRAQAEHEGRRAGAVRRLIDHPRRAWLAGLGLGSLGLSLAAAGCVGLIRTWRLDAVPAVLLGVAFLALAIIAGQLAPRGLASRRPEAAALAVAWPIDLAARLFSPLLGRTAHALGAEPPAQARTLPGGELRALLSADEEDGSIETDEMQMITGVMELGHTKVHKVMVPRIDIVAIPRSASLDEALDTIIQAGHSRIPVYGDTIDDIVGLLYAKDLLSAFRRRDFGASVEGFLREPHFVPESKPVDALLAELKSRQVHMAIVVDEYGGTAGLVTIEDLLEEIVGEIQDEYDAEEPPLIRLGPDEAIVDAGQNIDDVNRMLDLHLPTDDVNTLAGLVFARLGRVPVPGEQMALDDAVIEVVDVEGRRAQRVRIRRQSGEQVAGWPGGSPPPAAEVEPV